MSKMRIRAAGIAAAVGVLIALPIASGAATLAPLATEEALPLAHGAIEGHLDFAYFRNRRFPEFTPAGAIDSQNLFQLPRFGANVGLGDWVEIQASFEMLLLDESLRDGSDNTVYGGGDARLFTKVRVLREAGWRPAFGLRFGTKLPNANVDDRLGTDETDFSIEVLGSKTFGPVSAHLNLGTLLLGNAGATIPDYHAFVPGGQDDLFTWGTAVDATLVESIGGSTSLRLLGEFRGAAGSRFDNDYTNARAGVQVGRGAFLAHFGLSVGIAGAAEDVGVIAGLVYRVEPGRWFGEPR